MCALCAFNNVFIILLLEKMFASINAAVWFLNAQNIWEKLFGFVCFFLPSVEKVFDTKFMRKSPVPFYWGMHRSRHLITIKLLLRKWFYGVTHSLNHFNGVKRILFGCLWSLHIFFSPRIFTPDALYSLYSFVSLRPMCNVLFLAWTGFFYTKTLKCIMLITALKNKRTLK